MKKYFIFALLFIITPVLFAQKAGDKVIAVVGNEIILESDFQYQVQLYARQNGLQQIPPALAQQIFQQMLTDKIIYAKAVQDSIEIEDSEISRELDFRVQNLTAQLGSVQQVEQVYGMSLARIKLQLKEDLRKKLMAERLKRQRFQGGIRISDKEVREFFNTYRDSLPPAQEEYELSEIYMTRKVSVTEINEAKNIASGFLDSLRDGKSFEELALKYSSDSGSAKMGGDLGPATRGMFVKEFEEAAYNLEVGQVSAPVATEYGVHIIKLENRTGDNIRARHILIPYPRYESSDLETISFMNDLRSKIIAGEITFEDAAREYSSDPESKKDGGYIGMISVERLDSNQLAELRSLSPGDISRPVRIGQGSNVGYSMLKYIRYSSAHPLTLTTDYETIKKYALYFKENNEMEEWLAEIQEDIYVDIRY